MTEVKNLYLRFQKRYGGKSKEGKRPYINIDTINEHEQESPLIWGQFTEGKSKDLISEKRIEELNKNKGYVFFISNDDYGGTRLFYGEILSVYSNEEKGEKISQNERELIPEYYQELYDEHINDNEQKYKFKVGLWIKISFFRELDLSILDEIISISRLNSYIGKKYEPSIGDMRRRRAFSLSYFEFSSENIKPKDYEDVSLMRRLTLLDGSIIPPIRKGMHSFGVKEIESTGREYYSIFNSKIFEVDTAFINKDNSLNSQEKIDVEKYTPYAYEFYPLKNVDINLTNEFYANVRIYSAIDKEIGIKEIEENQLIEGTIKYCASPPLEEKAFLKIDDNLNETEIEALSQLFEENLNKIDEYISEQNILLETSTDVQLELENKINVSDDLQHIQVDVYNTGQANWVKLSIKATGRKSYNVMFDIGYQNKTYLPLVKEILSNPINYIILSHWDTDHIFGALQVLTYDKTIEWLAPQNSSTHSSASYSRLVIYLASINKLKLISNRFNNNQIFSNSFFNLYKGDGIGQNTPGRPRNPNKHYLENNNIGLIIELERNEKKMLLTGDCEYSSIPIDFSAINYNYLVASHHGAKTTTVPVSGVSINNQYLSIEPSSTHSTDSKGLAIVCCNSGPKYPDVTHKSDLESNCFEVVKTGSYDKGIRIKL